MTAISVQNLRKAFDDVVAVDDVCFDVMQGELFGFLGPNGAGKTTTINMLTGLARPDSGDINISGIDCVKRPRTAQHLIGIVPDESNLYPELTGFENLCFCASLFGIGRKERESRASELLEEFELSEASGRKFSFYSKGMKRKLTIAAGMIHRPKILFLDEPTTGIDVASARKLRQIVNNLHKKGTTIFLTTHYIEEAERLCDRIAFIVSGNIVKSDSVSNLLNPVKDRHIVQFHCSNALSAIKRELDSMFPTQKVLFLEENMLVIEDKEVINISPVTSLLESRGVDVFEARRIIPSLEDVFCEITGVTISEMKKDRKKGGKV